MMTEDEAKTKFCPMETDATKRLSKCIGSACMMWRGFTEERYQLGAPGEPVKTYPAGSGYCGLAGRPA